MRGAESGGERCESREEKKTKGVHGKCTYYIFFPPLSTEQPYLHEVVKQQRECLTFLSLPGFVCIEWDRGAEWGVP